jgi:hypothetical protein
MADHPLHFEIGEILEGLMKDHPTMDVILSQDCGGNQNIPLFVTTTKSNKTEICDVDAMVKMGDAAKIIIEIEESENKPVHLFGKYLASNLAKLYEDKNGNKVKLPNSSVCFIQIVDTKGLPEKSSKPEQFGHIEAAITDLISGAENLGCVKEYKLFQINGNDANKKKFDDLKDWINQRL